MIALSSAIPLAGISSGVPYRVRTALPNPDTAHVILAWVCLAWYITVQLVCYVGRLRIHKLSRRPSHGHAAAPASDSDLPFVTILRPIKGDEAHLELCLTSACHVDYPPSKFEILLCVASPWDEALPTIRRIINKNKGVTIRLFDHEEDVGPNPKIRNLSKAYNEATGDIVWMLDSNIWVPPGILKRSVYQLQGSETSLGFKLVHHLPICVGVPEHADPLRTAAYGQRSLLSVSTKGLTTPLLQSATAAMHDSLSHLWKIGGGRLEENFMSSSHAKFYAAINTVGVAPCIVGKSNLFRRSHLAEVTRSRTGSGSPKGLRFFAENICEDHMLGDRLWCYPVDDEVAGKRKWRRHGMGSDAVFQPIAYMPVDAYLARRTRWLRVRKYTVLAATLLEPMTESILCSLMAAYAFTTLSACRSYIGSSWLSFWLIWGACIFFWARSDRKLYNFLHGYSWIEIDENTPRFLVRRAGRSFGPWILQWIGREIFAPLIWLWAMWPGYVNWRGGLYKVRYKDLKVEEVCRASTKTD